MRDTHETNHLRIMIERMQRAGYPEQSIHQAVREAAGNRRNSITGPKRRPGRFGLLGRIRRP